MPAPPLPDRTFHAAESTKGESSVQPRWFAALEHRSCSARIRDPGPHRLRSTLAMACRRSDYLYQRKPNFGSRWDSAGLSARGVSCGPAKARRRLKPAVRKFSLRRSRMRIDLKPGSRLDCCPTAVPHTCTCVSPLPTPAELWKEGTLSGPDPRRLVRADQVV